MSLLKQDTKTMSSNAAIVKLFLAYVRKNPEVLKLDNIEKMCAKIHNDAFPLEMKEESSKDEVDEKDLPSFKVKTNVSTKRIVGDLSIFKTKLTGKALDIVWENMYFKVMNKKYIKGSRNFSKEIKGTPYEDGQAPIFMVPRVRGGASYKSIPLKGVDNDDVQYCPISKGYPMQDVSSFTLGPVVGEGLNVVNAAFSKEITVGHIEGGGVIDYTRKTFWKRSSKPKYKIEACGPAEQVLSFTTMKVNGKKCDTREWLRSHEKDWLKEWQKWRKSVALCSMGDFHWTKNLGETVAYRKGDEYLNFIEWKKTCYIRPAVSLLKETTAYKFMYKVWKKKNIPLVLVHPKNVSSKPEEPITKELIISLIESKDQMLCLPYVLAGCLLGVDM